MASDQVAKAATADAGTAAVARAGVVANRDFAKLRARETVSLTGTQVERE